MSYHQDWLMRQIEAISASLAYLLFDQKKHITQIAAEEQTTSDLNELYRLLRSLTDQGKLCEAENLLYEAIDREDPEALSAGVRFYADLNRFSDPELASCNFSREEIADGLQELCARFGLDSLTGG